MELLWYVAEKTRVRLPLFVSIPLTIVAVGVAVWSLYLSGCGWYGCLHYDTCGTCAACDRGMAFLSFISIIPVTAALAAFFAMLVREQPILNQVARTPALAAVVVWGAWAVLNGFEIIVGVLTNAF